MTFIIAFARPDFGLIAADTRMVTRAGIDGRIVEVNDRERKIHPYEAGWIASGPSVRFRDNLMSGLSPLKAMASLEIEDPELARLVGLRQMTFITAPSVRHVTNWDGSSRFPTAKLTDTLALCPHGSDPDEMQRLLNLYQHVIEVSALELVIQETRRLFDQVYLHCGPTGTVSPSMSIGLVWPNGCRTICDYALDMETVR